jgi:hypothetical protein
MDPSELKSGTWLTSLVRWVLQEYSASVDAAYIQRKYPGAGPVNQAKKAIQLASKQASVAGAVSAGAVTALELSIPASAGLDAPLAIPAIGTAILTDLVFTSRLQLRAAYDLSVIHGAPLSLGDAEDVLFILAASLGVRVFEAAGDVARAVGPKLVAYNVRKLLRAGLRSAIVSVVKKVAGTQLAKRVTERAAMRLLLPGISVPISAGANYLFTRSFLRQANSHMVRRGAVIQPLMRLHRHAPGLDPVYATKAFIVVMEAPRREHGWDEQQLQALRSTQIFTCLSDETIAALDAWFDRAPQDVAASAQPLSEDAKSALRDYLICGAALGVEGHDRHYARSISQILEDSSDHTAALSQRRRQLQ